MKGGKRVGAGAPKKPLEDRIQPTMVGLSWRNKEKLVGLSEEFDVSQSMIVRIAIDLLKIGDISKHQR